jgi:hypothetical protein
VGAASGQRNAWSYFRPEYRQLLPTPEPMPRTIKMTAVIDT